MIPLRSVPILIISALAIALVGWMVLQTESRLSLYAAASPPPAYAAHAS